MKVFEIRIIRSGEMVKREGKPNSGLDMKLTRQHIKRVDGKYDGKHDLQFRYKQLEYDDYSRKKAVSIYDFPHHHPSTIINHAFLKINLFKGLMIVV